MIIYKITNILNSKVYIGQTKRSLKERFNQHIWDSNGSTDSLKFAIHRAIKKYGKENFIIEQIDSASCLDEMNSKEKYWIKFYNCMAPNGYNLRDGGEQGHFSEDVVRKMTELKWCNPPKGKYKYKGIQQKKNGTYMARIKNANHQVELGDYSTDIEAAWSFDEGVRRYRNGKGYLNFPNGPTEELKSKIKKSALKNLNKCNGVSWCKQTSSWLVTIFISGKSKNLGRRKDRIEAMCLYDRYVIENKLDKPLNFTMKFDNRLR